jgi:hypothetical protein
MEKPEDEYERCAKCRNMKKASEGKGICVFICGDCIKAIQKKKVWSGDTV